MGTERRTIWSSALLKGCLLTLLVALGRPGGVLAQEPEVSGRVTSAESGQLLSGVRVSVQGTARGAITTNGDFRLRVPSLSDTLVFELLGYGSVEIPIDGRTRVDVALATLAVRMDEIVVVGYGVQRRSDVTGSVVSIPAERIAMAPNISLAQAIQGAMPGVSILATAGGAEPQYGILVRGRNSITADNSPLIVVDNIPYGGALSDIDPKDIASIQILKDGSASAIYGSRGANGVILLTTRRGTPGESRFTFDSKVSSQRPVRLPDLLTGAEFFQFKETRIPGLITQSEREIFDSGTAVDWLDLGLRDGRTVETSLSVSGGDEAGRFNYFLSGGLSDVQGLALNDDYKRYSARVNLDAGVLPWLDLGIRSTVSMTDRSGVPVITEGNSGIFKQNPLTRAFDGDGNPQVYIWPEFAIRENPLAPTLYENVDETRQILANQFALLRVPALPGLTNRINVGVRHGVSDAQTYIGRNTKVGLEERGAATLNDATSTGLTLENVLSYDRAFGRHGIFATGMIGSERESLSQDLITARGFPNDLLTWRGLTQAELLEPGTDYTETTLLSQMLRLNYSFDSRYLATFTVRRDGFSGFGENSKWGTFPSLALAWNLHREPFLQAGPFDELKLRLSLGRSGNQAVGAYQTIARMREENMISRGELRPGFVPGTLAQEDLGWESSQTLNLGVDFSILEGRLAGSAEYYRTDTSDLLLDRTISLVHGITSITQNIGQTRNSGVELSLASQNIATDDFLWTSRLSFATNQNRIQDLYGDRTDDVANSWFIGQPVRVYYGFQRAGVWQLDEAEEAASWNAQPGYLKWEDLDGDGRLTDADRQIIGQKDPDLLWGLENDVSFRGLRLSVFMHGVHGLTKVNMSMRDNVFNEVQVNTIKKNWWTPTNPTNEWVMNSPDAGGNATFYDDASFIRLKDVTLSYDLPGAITGRLGIESLRLYASGRNLYTVTDWKGVDPETDDERFEGGIPLQRELTVGATISVK